MVDSPFPPTSPRPTIVVDAHGRPVADPELDRIGFAGPLGRGRILKALRLGDGPRLLVEPAVIVDQHGHYLTDPDGALIGRAPLWVHRMLSARTVEDTRRLG